jgi:hypothetical protein
LRPSRFGAQVVVLTFPGRDSAAQFGYIDRRVVGLAFGPRAELGIGLDRGDANKMVFATEMVHRTEPHPGRERTRWALTASFDGALLASAGVAPSAPAPVAAPAQAAPARSKMPASSWVVGGAVAAVVGAIVWWAMW